MYFSIVRAALICIKKLNDTDIDVIASHFARESQQIISPEIVADFKKTGLSNEQFLTSDFLEKHGLKNIHNSILC